MISGIPIRKYHFCVLCLKVNIPAYTPKLPKAVAMKNSLPSDIRRAPTFLERILSYIILRKVTMFIRIIIPRKILKAGILNVL